MTDMIQDDNYNPLANEPMMSQQNQFSALGNWGDLAGILGNKLSGCNLFQGMSSGLSQAFGGIAGGMAEKAGGFLAGGTGQALLKGLGTTGPGLAFMAGSKLLGAFGGAKKAQAESKRIGAKVTEINKARQEASELRDEQDVIAKDEHLSGVKKSGDASGVAKSKVLSGEEVAYEGSGFSESGEIDYKSEVATQQIDKSSLENKEGLDKVLGQTLASNEEAYTKFSQQADATIAGLRKARESLKTKWYQNLA